MGKKITYRGLDALVNSFAKALIDLGVGKGDKVAMLLPNIPQVVIANYATFRIGAVASMNNPLYSERELQHQLDDSDAKVLVTLDLLLPRTQKILSKTKVQSIITCHISDYLPFPKKQLFPLVKKQMFRKIEPAPGVYEFLDIIGKYPDSPVANAADWDELGTLIYTGGTTGVSKGVMLTHANMSCNTQQLRYWFAELKDGWLFTGDIGFLDDDGYLTIVDRKKDMIVASGYNIFPQEIDEVLFEHPKILEACTIGVSDDYRGEAPKAYVVLRQGETLEKEEIIAHCKQRLAAYKVPHMIEFIDELPKSAVGKILRRELKELDTKKREEGQGATA